MTLGNMRANASRVVSRSRLRSLLSCPMLILKRASKSRPSGQWLDDDYDVFDGDQLIGRIM